MGLWGMLQGRVRKANQAARDTRAKQRARRSSDPGLPPPPPPSGDPRAGGLSIEIREQLRSLGDLDVVGESNYQDALSEICGGRTSDGANHRCRAVLVPEPKNLYDENAVCVQIEGRTAGYLAKPMAKALQPALIAYQDAHGHQFECDATIVGGWRRGDDLGHFGVKLSFDPDELG